MPKPTVIEILKQLPKTNCRECGQPTCMAFAALALQGQVELSRCPHLDSGTIGCLSIETSQPAQTAEARRDDLLSALKTEITMIDFTRKAPKLNATTSDNRISVRCLGKNFELDQEGNLHSECHINAWVHLPILNYVVRGKGGELRGEWRKFNELNNTADWARFFSHRCEKGMQDLADSNPELFFDVMDLFAAGKAGNGDNDSFESADYAIILYPLPKVPMLIAYWKAEQEFDAKLSILFDRSLESNLEAESVYLLVMGLLEMLRRIALRHGFRQ